jgi:hypothetical protein
MTPLQRLEQPLPAQIRDKITAVVSGYRAEFDQREVDYFYGWYEPWNSYEMGVGRRGTEEWTNAKLEGLSIGRSCFTPPELGLELEWFEHYRTDKEEHLLVGGYGYKTFRDHIESDITEIIESYIYWGGYAEGDGYADEGEDEVDWSDECGDSVREWIDELLSAALGR